MPLDAKLRWHEHVKTTIIELQLIWKKLNWLIGRELKPVRIIDVVSHTTYVVCVNILYISGGTYSLKSTWNERFFEKLFVAILFTIRTFARNLERQIVEKLFIAVFILNTFCILF